MVSSGGSALPPVVLLSHRAPISVDNDEDGGGLARSGGGLVTALTGLAAQVPGTVWVCVAATEADRAYAAEHGGRVRLALDGEPRLAGTGHEVAPAGEPPGGPAVDLRFVQMAPEIHGPFYGEVANPLLWFIQHQLYPLAEAPVLGRPDREAFEDGYVVANRLAAEAVVEEVLRAGGEAVVMLQDYHFYLVGELVRQGCPDAVISHFVHIPWPGPDSWRILPPDIRHRLLTGLLGCDVVAFHTQTDARNFLLCVQELAGTEVHLDTMQARVDGRTVRARAYPISIDVEALEALAYGADADRYLAGLNRSVGDRQLVLRVDRTDPSKNIVRGFLAFDHLLRDHPELRGSVVFLALLQPSRQDVPEYQHYLRAVGAVVAEVNARHSLGDWQPVDLRLVAEMPLAAAAYRRCDVLMVNAVADGMNLVAKEAVVVNQRDMVLALSESTGAYLELGHVAVTLHPFDVDQQADALYTALTMAAAERGERLREAARVVRHNDVARWVQMQLEDLQRWST